MKADTTSKPVDAQAESSTPPDAVRMIVINNSQIIGVVTRAAFFVGILAVILGFSRRAIPVGHLKDGATIFEIGLVAVCLGLMILSQLLDRALRRCPVCRTRITSTTEEKRRCLECNTELWGYWDE